MWSSETESERSEGAANDLAVGLEGANGQIMEKATCQGSVSDLQELKWALAGS